MRSDCFPPGVAPCRDGTVGSGRPERLRQHQAISKTPLPISTMTPIGNPPHPRQGGRDAFCASAATRNRWPVVTVGWSVKSACNYHADPFTTAHQNVQIAAHMPFSTAQIKLIAQACRRCAVSISTPSQACPHQAIRPAIIWPGPRLIAVCHKRTSSPRGQRAVWQCARPFVSFRFNHAHGLALSVDLPRP